MIARKPLNLPPAVARAFVDDMRAYFAEPGNIKQGSKDRGYFQPVRFAALRFRLGKIVLLILENARKANARRTG
jgi:hypothetical protein